MAGTPAAVAGISLLTKYLIRYRGSHVFNPSNVGLVAAFLILGEEVIEPLDFWWAPLGLGMGLAYLVILVGGLLITRRLRLLTMAAAFWVTLVAGIGVLAVSGHCMTAAWALQPVWGTFEGRGQGPDRTLLPGHWTGLGLVSRTPDHSDM